MRYYNSSSYFRRKYGKRFQKICIDGGFSCPNRDGTSGVGGCIFCGERGAGEHINPGESIRRQAERALNNGKSDDIFIAYFQNFTNTHENAKTLKERYDAALIDERIKVLAIGTRPDCIDKERADLLASYKNKCEVWVELGLQTSDDEIAKEINRGYKTEKFEEAVKLLKERGIEVIAHVIFGLPGASRESDAATIDYVAKSGVDGVKIHSIYVMKGTRLEEMYNEGRYTPPALEDFVERAVYAVRHLPSNMVIHRLTANCQRDLLVAPTWNDKNLMLDNINEVLDALDAHQGDMFEE